MGILDNSRFKKPAVVRKVPVTVPSLVTTAMGRDMVQDVAMPNPLLVTMDKETPIPMRNQNKQPPEQAKVSHSPFPSFRFPPVAFERFGRGHGRELNQGKRQDSFETLKSQQITSDMAQSLKPKRKQPFFGRQKSTRPTPQKHDQESSRLDSSSKVAPPEASHSYEKTFDANPRRLGRQVLRAMKHVAKPIIKKAKASQAPIVDIPDSKSREALKLNKDCTALVREPAQPMKGRKRPAAEEVDSKAKKQKTQTGLARKTAEKPKTEVHVDSESASDVEVDVVRKRKRSETTTEDNSRLALDHSPPKRVSKPASSDRFTPADVIITNWALWEPAFADLDYGNEVEMASLLYHHKHADGTEYWVCRLKNIKMTFTEDTPHSYTILACQYLTDNESDCVVATRATLQHSLRTGHQAWRRYFEPTASIKHCCDALCEDAPGDDGPVSRWDVPLHLAQKDNEIEYLRATLGVHIETGDAAARRIVQDARSKRELFGDAQSLVEKSQLLRRENGHLHQENERLRGEVQEVKEMARSKLLTAESEKEELEEALAREKAKRNSRWGP
ncbi:hypothetical protein S40285_05456 [Stachybotrys chlorohalonatus IBT 40285]|uniref:Uncharacterized protein n=1 Tax=Stachybotrys chlorohalonatus (strain IBT 40285) TaxID=1283841 RepID=A0A084QYL9_STAC4|nr:hypothetical protein S40285_05456 [Stachybotrys chlorohalonata IBT 40285]